MASISYLGFNETGKKITRFLNSVLSHIEKIHKFRLQSNVFLFSFLLLRFFNSRKQRERFTAAVLQVILHGAYAPVGVCVHITGIYCLCVHSTDCAEGCWSRQSGAFCTVVPEANH